MTGSVLIVGCGLSGAVLAEKFANDLKKKVTIIDKRDHIAGNVYDFIHPETGILMNKYGAHIFHTNNDRVWNYVQKFSEWVRWDHRVLAYVDKKYVPVPVNINTVNSLCSTNIETTDEMNKWLKDKQVHCLNIKSSEDVAKQRVGEELYTKLFKSYTFKQWNKFPRELHPSVLERIPVRNSWDDRYFTDKYQAMPKHGYTQLVKNMLTNPNINVKLSTDFFEFIKQTPVTDFDTVIYTGPIDRYFEKSNLAPLEYRSIQFTERVIRNCNYYQVNSVVNYPEPDVPFTRIVEYKHFLHQQSPHTVVVEEETCDSGEPYYPVPNDRNHNLYNEYKSLADKETNVHFIGRLANYKYFNMDAAILNALEYFDTHFKS